MIGLFNYAETRHLKVGSRCGVVVVVSADGSRVVSTDGWRVLVVNDTARRSDSRASVGSVMAWAIVVSWCSKTAASGGGDWDSTYLGIANTSSAAVALPELNTRALGVAISWAGAESLFLLVLATHEELENGGDEEEDRAEDSDGEAGRVEAAGEAER